MRPFYRLRFKIRFDRKLLAAVWLEIQIKAQTGEILWVDMDALRIQMTTNGNLQIRYCLGDIREISMNTQNHNETSAWCK